MIYYVLPGDTLSSIAGKHWRAIAATTLDAGVEWLVFRNPGLLRAGGPLVGSAYYIDAWQLGGVNHAPTG